MFLLFAVGKGCLLHCKQAALKRVEAAVHPLVAEKRKIWLEGLATRGEPLAVLDVPLLYETGMEAEVRSLSSLHA